MSTAAHIAAVILEMTPTQMIFVLAITALLAVAVIAVTALKGAAQ
jgi:hypothetical protein